MFYIYFSDEEKRKKIEEELKALREKYKEATDELNKKNGEVKQISESFGALKKTSEDIKVGS